MSDVDGHRSAAGDRDPQPAAERGAHLAGDQPVENRPDQAFERRRTGPDALRRFEARPANALGERAQAPRQRASPGEALVDREIGALVDPRHRDQDRRLDGAHILDELRDRARVGDGRADGDRQIIAGGPLERVRQRQERQEEIARRGGDALARRLHVGDDVAVRQHHALGAAGRARRVDDRRQGLRRDRPLGRRLALGGGEPCGGANDARIVAEVFVRFGIDDDAPQLMVVDQLRRQARPIGGAVDD